MTEEHIYKQLENVIALQDVLNSQVVIQIKPKNKRSVIEYDTDISLFSIIENELVFLFNDIKGFNIKLDTIISIESNEYDEFIMTNIKLKNKNSVMIHSFKF